MRDWIPTLKILCPVCEAAFDIIFAPGTNKHLQRKCTCQGATLHLEQHGAHFTLEWLLHRPVRRG